MAEVRRNYEHWLDENIELRWNYELWLDENIEYVEITSFDWTTILMKY